MWGKTPRRGKTPFVIMSKKTVFSHQFFVGQLLGRRPTCVQNMEVSDTHSRILQNFFKFDTFFVNLQLITG